MKKLLILACICGVCLTACAKNLDNIPALSLVEEQGAEWAREKLAGYELEALHEVWGEPDGALSGFWGEVWFTDEEHDYRVTVYYDADGKVEEVRMDTAPGLEPAPDPEPEVESEPEPQPVDLVSLEEPPALAVTCGGEAAENLSPGYTWVRTMPTGETAALVACGPHPLQMKENLTVFETAEELAKLEFEVVPDELYVHAWDQGCTPECDGLSQAVTVRDGGEIELLPGGYIYEATAKWGDGQTSGGTGTYVFYVDKLYPGNE